MFWHDTVLEHDTGEGLWEGPPSDLLAVQELHPENAVRLENMRSVLQQGPLAPALRWREGRLAETDELERIHDAEYVRRIRPQPIGTRDGVRVSSVASTFQPTWAASTAAHAVPLGDGRR